MAVIAGIGAGVVIFVILIAAFGKNNRRGDASSDGSGPIWMDSGSSDHDGGDGGGDGGGGGD